MVPLDPARIVRHCPGRSSVPAHGAGWCRRILEATRAEQRSQEYPNLDRPGVDLTGARETARLARIISLAVVALLPTACRVAAEPVPAAPVAVAYVAYAAALPVLRLHASYAIGSAAYEVKLAFDTAGVFGALLHAHVDCVSSGTLDDGRARPSRYYAVGSMRGRPHVTQIDYPSGEPRVEQLAPPVEEDNEPVSAAQQAGTIDSLSAMAELIASVARTGRCDGTQRTFDGRRLSELSARTVGEESLAPTGRSTFSGRALRCDLEGRQLAGFARDADPGTAGRPLHGSAWFASLAPGTPAVPVRISFETRFFGAATAYLVAR